MKNDYFNMENRGEIFYKEWLAESRQDYDLVVFANIKNEFLKDKMGSEDIDKTDIKQFVLDLAKEKSIGQFFHNSKGPAYGAMYKFKDGRKEIKHEEYWMNGKRILEEQEIKKIIHTNLFNEKADEIING